jgi:hypothetical protein
VITKLATRWSKLALLASGALVLAAATISPSYAAADTEIYIVQGLPDHKLVDVAIDDKLIAPAVAFQAVAGPFKVKPGTRKVTFSENGTAFLERTFSIKEGSTADVVAHLPASATGDLVVTVFPHEDVKVPRGRASLVVAHVAAVPLADMRLNKQVLSTNIANTRSEEQVVPAAKYKFSVAPTGMTEPVFLGTDLQVNRDVMNRVYVMGDPEKKTMTFAKNEVAVGTVGSDTPSEIEVNTGTGGQAVGDGPSLEVNLAR